MSDPHLVFVGLKQLPHNVLDMRRRAFDRKPDLLSLTEADRVSVRVHFLSQRLDDGVDRSFGKSFVSRREHPTSNVTNMCSDAINGAESDRVKPVSQGLETTRECVLIRQACLLASEAEIGHHVFDVDGVLRRSALVWTGLRDAQNWVDGSELPV